MFGGKYKGGRCNSGQITSPRRGGLTKRLYRYLDIKRRIWAKEGAIILQKYVYDPNRTGFISLIMLPNGLMTYILAPKYSEEQQWRDNLIPLHYKEKGTSLSLKEISLRPILSVIWHMEKEAGLLG